MVVQGMVVQWVVVQRFVGRQCAGRGAAVRCESVAGMSADSSMNTGARAAERWAFVTDCPYNNENNYHLGATPP